MILGRKIAILYVSQLGEISYSQSRLIKGFFSPCLRLLLACNLLFVIEVKRTLAKSMAVGAKLLIYVYNLKRSDFFSDKKLMSSGFQLIKIFGLSMIAILCNQAVASDCKEIRLDSPGKPMSRIPVMDQDSKSICYAYSASQMVDAWRFSHGDKDFNHLTSPPATAIFYTSQRTDSHKTNVDFGWEADAIASIARNGSCDYRTIYHKFGQNGLNEYFDELKFHFDQFKLQSYQRSVYTLNVTKQIQCSIRKAGKGFPIPMIAEITSALSQPSYIKYLEQLFKPICAKNMKQISGIPPAKRLFMKDLAAEDRIKKVQKQINSQLNSSNPQPMGIGYCENVLWNKNIVGINTTGEVNWNSCNVEHSSIIIGQRPTSEWGCELLVRNSHGQSCHAYHDWDCENGQIWVDSTSLIKNMTELSWLED